ncbi:MOSC domain-containing protein [Candidatus Peregrinibacteria bacterium]|nr:MOSC domain-containing protein [Candidatus Peregrinibacteria bacterium]
MPPIREAYIAQCEQDGKLPYAKHLHAIPKHTEGLRGLIASLCIYPGKALGGLSIPSARITKDGLETEDGLLRDRSFMLGQIPPVMHNAMFTRFSQRNQAKLALMQPHFDGRKLIYEAPGVGKLEIDPEQLQPQNGDVTTVEVIPNTVVYAVRECGPINAYVKNYLKSIGDDPDKVEVLLPSISYLRHVEDRHSCGERADTLFTDGGQQLLASYSSLTGEASMKAVRPNIGVRGWIAFLEDILKDAQIKGKVHGTRWPIRMLFGDLSVRCAVTMINPETGIMRTDGEPLKTWKNVRPFRVDGTANGKPTFGVNTVFPEEMTTDKAAVISVDDEIIAGSEKTFGPREVL